MAARGIGRLLAEYHLHLLEAAALAVADELGAATAVPFLPPSRGSA